MEEIYLICEDSIEGIFTGIYNAYLKKMPHEQLHISVGMEENLRLFARYENCLPEEKKAESVTRTLIREFGEPAFREICMALASEAADKGEAVYKAMVTGFHMKNRKKLMENLTDTYVHRVFELARNTSNETHAHIEFIRFREYENGILYAKMEPKNNIAAFLMPHFADRLPLENFVIHDKRRNLSAVHPAGREWFLWHGREETEAALNNLSKEEKRYGELFAGFFHTIAIKERKNQELQREMLPLRYRKYMTEFTKNE